MYPIRLLVSILTFAWLISLGRYFPGRGSYGRGPQRLGTHEYTMSDLISRWRGRPLHLVFGAILLVLTAGVPASAAPMASALEMAKAERIGQMPDEAPSHRINQILAAKDFNEAELFALAGTHPVLVQHFTEGELKLATDYLLSLDGAELHKMRIGGTLIRMTKSLSAKEKKTLRQLSDYLNESHDKLRGVKIGPQDGRAYVLQLTYQIKKKKQRTYEFELVPPATPQREEEARVALTKHFRARPSRVEHGVGSSLKLRDGSFENPYALADTWRLMEGTMLGAPSPVQEVMLDERQAIDGSRSLRFYGTERTRLFQNVVQEVPVTPGTTTRLRVQHKTEHIRIEFQQRRTDFKVQVTYMYNGVPVSPPHSAPGRMGSHVWEMLEVESQVPYNANEARIELIASLSGTAWFDGIIFEVIEGEQ